MTTSSCAQPTPQPPAPDDPTFRADVLRGLGAARRSLPCKYFYVAAGSALFDQICDLDEYYPTRTEAAILRTHGQAIAREIGPGAVLLEPGAGSSTKTRILLRCLQDPAAYLPVDISAEHLEASARALRRDFPGLHVAPVAADFTHTFTLPDLPRPGARIAVAFLGSTIGNFEPSEARQILRHLGHVAGPGGCLLVGTDLDKDPAVLQRAYDDRQGITAAFNKNLLARINRELGGTFDLAAFDHRATYEPGPRRVRIELVSRHAQRVRVAGHTFAFARDEPILTEYSHKYTIDSFAALAREADLELGCSWTDPERLFGVHLLRVP